MLLVLKVLSLTSRFFQCGLIRLVTGTLMPSYVAAGWENKHEEAQSCGLLCGEMGVFF